MSITPTIDETGHKVYEGHYVDTEDTNMLNEWIRDPIDHTKLDLEKVKIIKEWIIANNIDAFFLMLLDTKEMEVERKQFIEYLKTL